MSVNPTSHTDVPRVTALLSRHSFATSSRAAILLREAYEEHDAVVAEAAGSPSGQGFLIDQPVTLAEILAARGARKAMKATPVVGRITERSGLVRIGFLLLFTDRSALVAEATSEAHYRALGTAAPFLRLRLHPVVQYRDRMPEAVRPDAPAPGEAHPDGWIPAGIEASRLGDGRLTLVPGGTRADRPNPTGFDASRDPLATLLHRQDPAWAPALAAFADEIATLLVQCRGWKTPCHPMDGGRPDSDWPPYLPWMNATQEALDAINVRLDAVARLARARFADLGIDTSRTEIRAKLVFGDGRRTLPIVCASCGGYGTADQLAAVSAEATAWFFSGAWAGFAPHGRQVAVRSRFEDEPIASSGLMAITRALGKAEPATGHVLMAQRALLARQPCPALDQPWRTEARATSVPRQP